ncbi:MAG: acyl-CoA desaturase [Bdellovibrionota bacterium]
MSHTPGKTKLNWIVVFPILFAHLGCLFVFSCGTSTIAVTVCLLSYFTRMFGITAGYHRYFSHRTYKTGRGFQFVLAVLGATAGQLGPIWWAAHHRQHHRYPDKDEDVHSPLRGFWWAHIEWFLLDENGGTRTERVRDLLKYPELRMLDRYYLVPPLALAALTYALGNYLSTVPELHTSGIQMLVWGFFISTVLLAHATFAINSIAHLSGSRRYDTDDQSRNNLFLAIITLGEGWHNNHHRYPGSERQGFFWWEIDISHYMLVLLERCGLVSDLRTPPDRLLSSLSSEYNNASGQTLPVPEHEHTHAPH